jgi:DNA-binding NarL/FixJ family response regulator
MYSVSPAGELRQDVQFCGGKVDPRRHVSPLRLESMVIRSIPRSDRRRVQNLDQVARDGAYRARSSARTLALIDSVRLTRECLGYFLRSLLPQFEIQSFSRADTALCHLRKRPDVAVVHVHPALIGDCVADTDIAQVVSATHCPPVLALLDKAETPAAYQAAQAHAAGVLPNDCCASLFVAAIYLLIEGGRFSAPTISSPPLNRRSIQGRDSGLNTIFYETASEADRKRIVNASHARMRSF